MNCILLVYWYIVQDFLEFGTNMILKDFSKMMQISILYFSEKDSSKPTKSNKCNKKYIYVLIHLLGILGSSTTLDAFIT